MERREFGEEEGGAGGCLMGFVVVEGRKLGEGGRNEEGLERWEG